MRYVLTLLLLILFTPLYGVEESVHKTIIVGSFLVQDDATLQKEQFERWAMQDPRIRTLRDQDKFFFVTRKSGPYLVVALEPIEDEKVVQELFELVKPVYHDAFISKVRSNHLLASYAKGIVPGAPLSSDLPSPVVERGPDPQSMPDDVSEKPLQAETASPKSTVQSIGISESAADDSYESIYLFLGLLALSAIVIYLLVNQRRSAEHVKHIEEEINTLNSSNDELSTVNMDFQESMNKQEELIEEMSDKLKDPAKSIMGRAERILETELNDKQSIELRNIHDSGQVLFAIIDDLLDFMKIRSNKLEIKEKPFDINELLDIIVRSVLERIEKKDVEVIFDIENSVPPRIIGDPIRIGQVLTNLLENGIKFTNAGEVKLHVKSLHKEGDSIQLMFEVIDTGIGIPESKLDDIFTPFYKINNNNSAGLGLSISKALVEMMGGEILVSTKLNHGSTFTFVLGLKEVDVEEKRHYRLPDSAYKPRRILIVDYHDSAASAMKKLLEYFHNDVDIFSQAEMETMSPDLSRYEILFVSEKLLSFELIKQIDQLKRSERVRVVVVGSMLHKVNNSNLVEKLADARLMKPVNQQNIFDLLVSFYGDELVIPMPDTKEDSTPSMPRIVIERTQKEDVTKEDFVLFSGARILVAEDNMINQKVISALLKESGIAVDFAENGQVALEMIAAQRYDLVLMDINMPVMNGYEATERLKASKETSALPVVALTGNTMPEELVQMRECGMDDRLEKPIRVNELYFVFSKYLVANVMPEKLHESALPDKLYVYDEALERCGGDKSLYKELVDEFIKLYKESDRLFQQYFSEKDAAAMKALSLDIKGVSANIGVYMLANAAQNINESSLSSTSMPKYLEQYRKILHKTLDALITKMKRL